MRTASRDKFRTGARARRADQSIPDSWLNVGLIFPPAFRQIIALELIDVDRQNRFGFLRQPFALRGDLENQRQNNRQQNDHRNDAEIKFPQLLFIDLAGKNAPARRCVAMSIDRRAMTSALRSSKCGAFGGAIPCEARCRPMFR